MKAVLKMGLIKIEDRVGPVKVLSKHGMLEKDGVALAPQGQSISVHESCAHTGPVVTTGHQKQY